MRTHTHSHIHAQQKRTLIACSEKQKNTRELCANFPLNLSLIILHFTAIKRISLCVCEFKLCVCGCVRVCMRHVIPFTVINRLLATGLSIILCPAVAFISRSFSLSL